MGTKKIIGIASQTGTPVNGEDLVPKNYLEGNFVANTVTVNGHPLSDNIVVTADDVGLGNIQNKTMDSTPTANSTNYVTSGGIKTYVDTAVAAIKPFQYKVVETLPTASADTMGVVYLVADEHSTTDKYDEFITILADGVYSWEKIGNTDIDLSGYLKIDGTSKMTGSLQMNNNNINNISELTFTGSGMTLNNASQIANVNKINFGSSSYSIGAPYSSATSLYLMCEPTGADVMYITHEDDDTKHKLNLSDTLTIHNLHLDETDKYANVDQYDVVNRKYVDAAISGAVPATADKAAKLSHDVVFSATGDVIGQVTTDFSEDAVALNLTIGTGKVTSSMIATNAVTTTKIADGNVTSAKIAATGVTARDYTAVEVNAQGQVTKGLQSTMFVTVAPDVNAAPADLATDGILFYIN